MSGEFTNKLVEMHQRVVIDLQTRINILTEREHKLEQLVNEAFLLLDRYTYPGTDDADKWLKRAKALLEQEVK